MRREPEFFGEEDLSLLYVAQKLKQALRLEEVLTDAGIDYLVEPDEYTVGTIIRRVRVGAFFYVAPTSDDAAREVLRRAGFKPAPADGAASGR
jgi:hypothetical protein